MMLPGAVEEMLAIVVPEIETTLANNLTGSYLRGSRLATSMS
jgi:hypothetical protein